MPGRLWGVVAAAAASLCISAVAAIAAAELTGPSAYGDWHADAPGVRRKITAADLPAPFATGSARETASIVKQPANAQPLVPSGFSVSLFADHLKTPRAIRVAPNGDIFVAESRAGQIRVPRAADGGAKPAQKEVFASGLEEPFGIAFYPPGPDPQFAYVANTDSVVRFPYKSGELKAGGSAETIIPDLVETGGGHWTRDIAFSPDGKRMYVSVGSGSNDAEGMPKTMPEGWEATHGLGAAWGGETGRADVLVFDPQGQGRRVYASGIRNCVGLAIEPKTGDPWCSIRPRHRP
jgi:glucose/arabinose dehydrogenase